MPTCAASLEWVAVDTLDNLWEGEMTDVQVGDEHVLVVRLAGNDVRVYQGHCPHQKMLLADGKLDGNILTCAAHLWQFNVSTGQGVNPESCQLHRYQSKIQDSTIFVAMVRV